MNTIDQLKPDPRNARKRTERSATLIGESLKRYGAARSIVIDEDDRILAGNGTVEQAKAAGISKVRVIETDGDEIIAVRRTGLTDQDKIGLAIADNRTSDLSEWDAEMLRQLDAAYELAPWFEEDEINSIEDALEGEMPALDSDDPTVVTMTFTLSHDQKAMVDAALDYALSTAGVTGTEGDVNKNGAAIAYVCDMFTARVR